MQEKIIMNAGYEGFELTFNGVFEIEDMRLMYDIMEVQQTTDKTLEGVVDYLGHFTVEYITANEIIFTKYNYEATK